VSQPFDRGSHVTAPGPLDSSLGEFWVENPWDIISRGHNLSAFERNRVFLNVQGRDFLDISSLTGADSDGDGRSVVAADFRNNGQLDLLVRQVGGGAVLLYENQFPRRHYLTVSLRGRRSNRLGIGARLKAYVGGRQLVRELYPHNTFRSQMPARVHFGLGDASAVDRLMIRWPSGDVQELTGLAADRHVVIEEGKSGPDAVEVVMPGQTIRP
jgi:enediyne biosynthesis protein E4